MASIDAFAKRYHPFIICGMLATVAYFQSSGISSLIAEQLPIPTSGATTSAEDAFKKLKQAKASTPTKSGSEVLSRNPFDSETGPISRNPPPPPAPTPTAPKTSHSGEPPKCQSGEVTLIAGSLDPSFSFAVISTGAESKMRRIGDDVDGKKVESILGESVVLASTDGDRCRLMMHEDIPAGEADASPKSGPTVPESMATKAVTPPRGKQMAGLRKISDTEYVFEEDAEQKLTAMKQAFLKSAKANDEKGLRLYRSAQSTILGQLGLKKGDIVKTVNGFDMSKLDQSTEAYERLPASKNVQIVLERGGKPVTVDVSVK